MASRRIPEKLEPNALAEARRAAGAIPFDLTETNPTACGFGYPDDLLAGLGSPDALRYEVDPRGRVEAREAVAREYARAGVAVDPGRIVLTASTSEAYSFLFRLLCDPGTSVLVPVPSYPLFDHLARLDGVRTVPYLLDRSASWNPRVPSAYGVDTARAAIVVHPNNPTGTWVDAGAAEALAAAGGRGAPVLPLIADEVFLDYPLVAKVPPRSFASRTRGLTFTLGGLSKSRGLPQLKLAWIVVSGPPAEVDAALAGLEYVADTYLSASTPVQLALPELLERARPVHDAILARCRENLAAAIGIVRPHPAIDIVIPDGGWSLVARFPRVVGEEALALALLRDAGVAIHPGYFFDFPEEGYFVVSLLPPLEIFARGFAIVLEAIAGHL